MPQAGPVQDKTRMRRRRYPQLGGGTLLFLFVLGGCCVLQQQVECSTQVEDYDYGPIVEGLPPGFIFGTASAAYQVSKVLGRLSIVDERLDQGRAYRRT